MKNQFVLKIISTTLIFCMVFFLATYSYASDTKSTINKSEPEIKFSTEGLHETIYVEEFKDDAGNDMKVKISYEGDLLVSSTFINGNLSDTTSRKILSDGTLDKNMEVNLIEKDVQKMLNVDDFVVTKERQGESISLFSESIEDVILSSTPSYPFRWSEYSSAWGYRGYLYGQSSNFTEQTYFYFSSGTLVSTIASSLATFLIGGVYTVAALCAAIGVGIVFGVINNVLEGGIEQYVNRWDNEVFVQNTLTLVGWYDSVRTDVYNKSGVLVDTVWASRSSGPYNNGSDMIHHGIYLYVLYWS